MQATVTYRIYSNGALIAKKQIDQGHNSNKGWTYLGEWAFNGANVRIEVWDNETSEHYSSRNKGLSRFGVDAIAMRCYQNCTVGGHGETLKDQYMAAINRTQGDIDPWNFFKGNCTSYVAWRLNDVLFDGRIVFTNQYRNHPRWGHAHMWWDAAVESNVLADQIPKRGAIAWWNKFSGGAGKFGHVAFVERVIRDGSSLSIIVSDMNYGALYKLRNKVTIGSNSWNWPDGFIHIN